MNKTDQAPVAIRCACRSWDRYTCWQLRYSLSPENTAQDIEADGGPCECACHDRYEDED